MNRRQGRKVYGYKLHPVTRVYLVKVIVKKRRVEERNGGKLGYYQVIHQKNEKAFLGRY